MDKLTLLIGRLVGGLGIVVVLVAVATRALGHFWLGGLQTGTLLLAGIGATAVGAFLLLVVLTARLPGR